MLWSGNVLGRMMRLHFISLFWIFGAIAAFSDGAKDVDFERQSACLSANNADPTLCFFHVSSLCENDELELAPSQMRALMWCDLRELDVWQRQSKSLFAKLIDELPKTEANDLQRQQSHWETGQSVYCDFLTDHLRGGWIGNAAVRCKLGRAQQRALQLIEYDRYLRSEEFSFQQ